MINYYHKFVILILCIERLLEKHHKDYSLNRSHIQNDDTESRGLIKGVLRNIL